MSKQQISETFENQKILIVDDEHFNIKVVQLALSPLKIKIFTANNGNKALQILKTEKIDLLLLDLMMPQPDGFAILKELNKMNQISKISVIILTAIQDTEPKVSALELGAVDFITKPFVRSELIARIKLHLKLHMYYKEINRYADHLEEMVVERTKELYETQNVIAFSLARLAESRDPETGDHLERMSRYAEVLAKELIKTHKDSLGIDEEFVSILRKVAVLHDIGKVGIPDNVLLKPGKLTKEEFDIMKTHTLLGGETLRDAKLKMHKDVRYLEIAENVAYYHHEKWNGKGYPKGLQGENIPICARIVALADVYDALRSKRVYKPAFSHEKAKQIILEEKGEHFDPLIVDTFLKVEELFIEISQKFAPKD